MNMLRVTGVASIGARMAFLGVERRDLDRDRLNHPIKRDLNTGVDRVRMIFDRREDGNISPELNSMNMAGFAGMMIGGVIGGIFYSRVANINFRESNEATLFVTDLVAKRKLQNESTVGFGKGFFRLGWRVGIFCWSFVGISTIVSRYRDKTSITDYSIAGLVTGALFKTNLGIKGMISGGFFGSLIGTVGGVALILLLKLSGKSMKEIRVRQTDYIYARDEALHASFKKQLPEQDILSKCRPSIPPTADFSYDFLSVLDQTAETSSAKKNDPAEKVKTAENVQPNTH